ncbi:MAG TPA: phosphate ABC transporter substrate-binding protein [Burkholderiales bacterium]|nr:phosphate ABC transporter substrate-binding protein [Burkholderiales bacterium]
MPSAPQRAALPRVTRLKTLLGDYTTTRALRRGELSSSRVAFDFADVPQVASAFKRTVRNLEFDVSELAIVTYLMAKAYGKPYVLLPAVVLGRFQHPFLVYNSARGELRPQDLNGHRVGIRSYSVTTSMWLRGILANDYGVNIDSVRWVTFEEPHVAEFNDPPSVERAPEGRELLKMLLDGEVDAAVMRDTSLPDPRLKRLIADPDKAARDWHAKNRAIQINHMVVVRDSLSKSDPDAVREVYRLLREAKRRAPAPAAGEPDMTPFGLEANRRNLEVAIDYVYQQRLIPRRVTVDELFDDVTRSLEP